MKQIIATLMGLCLSASLSAAEYQSSALCAKIAKNGYITELSYNGKVLLKSIQLEGSYSLSKDEEKYDSRFFQAWDYEGNAEISENGSVMTIHTKSLLGNSKIKKGADYESTLTLSPNELTIKSKITTLVELKTQMHIFRHSFLIPEDIIAGRGLRTRGFDKPESFFLIPYAYSKHFNVPASTNLAISIPSAILNFSADRQSSISFSDSRAWKGKSMQVNINYNLKWTPELICYPPGTVFEWESRFELIPD